VGSADPVATLHKRSPSQVRSNSRLASAGNEQTIRPAEFIEKTRPPVQRAAVCAMTEGPNHPIGERWRSAVGSARSLAIYYGNPIRQWRMDRLYSDFVGRGDLVFDIGSHVGDRIGSFRRLGCRVVAVEPQPRLVRILRRFYGRDPEVAIEPMAIAAAPGSIELFVNIDNASLTTASSSFVAAASAAPGWRGERWPGRVVVPAMTLDQLIERHGEPIFAKIDVEGFEAEALAGLSRPLEAFSFEFTTILRRIALACVIRCRVLGDYRYNASLGETQRLVFNQWVDAQAIEQWLEALPDSANSGDIYARLGARRTFTAGGYSNAEAVAECDRESARP
jgi:FkbM family methyltransferase